MDFEPVYRDILPPPTASSVKVLFCGFGPLSDAGAWLMRAEQVAARRSNWRAIRMPTEVELNAADVVCFVKKPNRQLHKMAKALGKICVYDVVDGWKQPDANRTAKNADEARAYFRERWSIHEKFDATIFANRAMYQDLGALVRCPAYIYHHALIFNVPVPQVFPLREQVRTVGYSGAVEFLGQWRGIIEGLCDARGLAFMINPNERYGEVDIGLAVRSDEWGGYLPSTYKSNVKVANFMATGTPCLVGGEELSYHEVTHGGMHFFHTPEQLAAGLDSLLPLAARQEAREKLLAAAPKFALDHVVGLFEHLFLTLWQRQQVAVRTAA